MLYALSNCVNGACPSWRIVDSEEDLAEGEIGADAIPDYPVWDSSLSDGQGALRSMTDTELAAIAAAASAQAAQIAANASAMADAKSVLDAGGTLTTTQLSNVLRAILAALS